MQDSDVKYGLRNYHKLREYVRLDLLEIEDIKYRMEGQGGGSIIPCDKGGGEIANDRTPLLNELIDYKDKLEKKVSLNTYHLQIAKEFVDWLPKDKRKMVIDKYVNRLNILEMEGRYNYSTQHISRIINTNIECFINEM